MQLKHKILVNAIVFVGVIWHVNAYFERRTFRERSRISCRLQKYCKSYEEWNAEIRTMMPLADVAGVQSENYLVRFPFYILAERDANIVFSETQNPDWLVDDVYEIAFGGWENKRTTLSRRREFDALTFSYTDEILSNNCPLKALIEITTAGDIRVFIEHTQAPIIEYKDPNPLKIAYFGFSSLGQSLARFYYDCRGDEIYTPGQLSEYCEKYSTNDTDYQRFVPIGANAIINPDNYLVNLPVFVTAKQDAHILIASDNSSLDNIQNGYEIVIGDHMNRRVAIHSIHDGSMGTLADVRRADIFQNNETLNALIQINNFGKVELFTKHDHTQYKLLASAKDPKYSQTSLHFLSFASHINTNIDFFHNCKTLPTYIDTQMATKYAPIGHPLLLDDPHFDAPIDKRNWLTSRCKYYTATKYEYRDFFALNNIYKSQPSGYQVRLAFYAQATRNAHVLLSRSSTPNLAEDNVYEFVIGGWVNSRVVIRRKKSAQDLQHVFVKPILSAQIPTKFIIEVSNSGFIRLFAESDKLEPIASVFDPNILPVKYVSFCAFDNLAKFYYDCDGDRS